MDSHMISSNNLHYKTVIKHIGKFQNGCCRFCKNKFTGEDIIISRKGRPRNTITRIVPTITYDKRNSIEKTAKENTDLKGNVEAE